METNKPQVKPDNYLVWAILTTLCCCLPFGIVAIVNSAGVDSAWSAGNYDEAVLKSRNAANWSKWAAISGVAVMVIYIIVLVVCGVGLAALDY